MPGSEPNYELIISAAKQFLLDIREERKEKEEAERGDEAA